MKALKRKTFNPKLHSPAVYIPCWLIQVSSKELSHQSKLLYGRLAQWSSTKGIVHRSVPQLSEEVGMSKSTIDRTLKELRSVGLIDTYQAEAGGINHYQFLEHDWMSATLSKSLENTDFIPHVTSGVTPTSDVTLPHVTSGVPKVKEIKRSKRESSPKVLKTKCPRADKLISAMSRDMIKKKMLDEAETIMCFIAYAKSQNWMRVDWKAAFLKWVIDQRGTSDGVKRKISHSEARSTVKEWRSSDNKAKRASPPAELSGLIKKIKHKSMVQQ